jgi:hypothetical protein
VCVCVGGGGGPINLAFHCGHERVVDLVVHHKPLETDAVLPAVLKRPTHRNVHHLGTHAQAR